jgi:hypothetical protein
MSLTVGVASGILSIGIVWIWSVAHRLFHWTSVGRCVTAIGSVGRAHSRHIYKLFGLVDDDYTNVLRVVKRGASFIISSVHERHSSETSTEKLENNTSDKLMDIIVKCR